MCTWRRESNGDFFFFFQAEDGIRDDLVTGVQTCALPISPYCRDSGVTAIGREPTCSFAKSPRGPMRSGSRSCTRTTSEIGRASCRGKSVDLGGRRIIKKKKEETRQGYWRAIKKERIHEAE